MGVSLAAACDAAWVAVFWLPVSISHDQSGGLSGLSGFAENLCVDYFVHEWRTDRMGEIQPLALSRRGPAQRGGANEPSRTCRATGPNCTNHFVLAVLPSHDGSA